MCVQNKQIAKRCVENQSGKLFTTWFSENNLTGNFAKVLLLLFSPRKHMNLVCCLNQKGNVVMHIMEKFLKHHLSSPCDSNYCSLVIYIESLIIPSCKDFSALILFSTQILHGCQIGVKNQIHFQWRETQKNSSSKKIPKKMHEFLILPLLVWNLQLHILWG